MAKAARKRAELTEAEWLERRRQYIGGSDAAAAVGMSRYKSRLDLWREKRGELVIETTEVMRRGKILEPLVAMLYARATGNKTEPGAWCTSEEHKFMAATPDLLDVTDNCIVQIKTTSTWARERWGPAEKPKAPDDYALQCYHEMAVTGAHENRLAVFFADQSTFRGLVWMVSAGMKLERVLEYVDDLIKEADSPCEFLVVPVFRNEPVIETLVNGEAEFWNTYVLPGVPPPDASIPQKSSEIIEADEQQRELLGRLRDAKRSQNNAKDTYDTLVAEVKTEIGDASGIKAEGICSITYKAPAAKEIIDYEGAVVEAKRKKIVTGLNTAMKRNTHMMPEISWDLVWAEVTIPVEQRLALLEKFSEITQGARKFAPRYAKD